MIVQITVTRDEGFLIKELLPQWKKYADGFVFLVDKRTTDNTRELLLQNKEEYNILEIIEHDFEIADPHELETNGRQKAFDAAFKYTKKIICLDTDEYLDGTLTKDQLENILDSNPDTIFLGQWIQYTNKTERRVDSFWREVFHDRIGSYANHSLYSKAFSHSSHLPSTSKAVRLNPNLLFIAHLQWLDKRWVGIKQYYWKTFDYVYNTTRNIPIINKSDYDTSVNNFSWLIEPFNVPLKIDEKIYSYQNVKENFKLKYIKENTQKYNIPNLGDWGMGIYEYCLK